LSGVLGFKVTTLAGEFFLVSVPGPSRHLFGSLAFSRATGADFSIVSFTVENVVNCCRIAVANATQGSSHNDIYI
jgi:hypothetical protein